VKAHAQEIRHQTNILLDHISNNLFSFGQSLRGNRILGGINNWLRILAPTKHHGGEQGKKAKESDYQTTMRKHVQDYAKHFTAKVSVQFFARKIG
jgi:hypothetical protein